MEMTVHSHSGLYLLALFLAQVLVLQFISVTLVTNRLKVIACLLFDELLVLPGRVQEPNVSVTHIGLLQNLGFEVLAVERET